MPQSPSVDPQQYLGRYVPTYLVALHSTTYYTKLDTIVSKTKCAPDVIYFLFAADVGPLISHPNPNCSLVLVNSSVDKSHNHRLCDYL